MKPSEKDIKELIGEIMGVDAAKIKSETDFKSDLAMDSIAIADLISSVEEDFDIAIGYEDAIKLVNFGLLMNFINQYE
jgi:acyl carrier protein